ncbi:hypothetical protein SCHPADRAFT_173052 [Schizopora paradoxa]|uniref:Uncharacterized protein n=1 Tax=Schizopora paradoxa TaxID=27342 RepID=A0A0H2SJL5_9AGAM|nr:hypothetical protein SCHPADRAFT_173052 [Schizopora paradoxa]
MGTWRLTVLCAQLVYEGQRSAANAAHPFVTRMVVNVEKEKERYTRRSGKAESVSNITPCLANRRVDACMQDYHVPAGCLYYAVAVGNTALALALRSEPSPDTLDFKFKFKSPKRSVRPGAPGADSDQRLHSRKSGRICQVVSWPTYDTGTTRWSLALTLAPASCAWPETHYFQEAEGCFRVGIGGSRSELFCLVSRLGWASVSAQVFLREKEAR